MYITVLAVEYAAVAVASFLLGAVPFAWLIGKLVVGVDLRYVGSGNPGATNLFRTAGAPWGILALLLDATKGWAPATIAPALYPDLPHLGVIAGAAAIAGHIWTPLLAFRGGKGVATTAGVFLAINFWLVVIGVATFAVVVAATRYVSAASLAGAAAATASSFLLPWLTHRAVDYVFVAFCVICFIVIVVAHRGNIKRLLAGTESKIGRRLARGRD